MVNLEIKGLNKDRLLSTFRKNLVLMDTGVSETNPPWEVPKEEDV